MRIRTTVCCLLLCAVCAVGLMAFQAPKVVNISLASNGSVQVSPDRIELATGDKVRWVSSGDSKDRVEITFDAAYGKKGPFPSANSSDNPSRGRYNKKVGSPILTKAAVDRGQWKYTVTWIKSNGTRIPLDPILVVR